MGAEEQQSKATALESEIASLRAEIDAAVAELPAPDVVEGLSQTFRVSKIRQGLQVLPRIAGAMSMSALFASAMARPSFWGGESLFSALSVMFVFFVFYVATGRVGRQQRKSWMSALQEAVPREPLEPVETERPLPTDYRDAHGSLEQAVARLETERDMLRVQRKGLAEEQRSFEAMGRTLLAATPAHRVDALRLPDWTWLITGGMAGLAHRFLVGDNIPLFNLAAVSFLIWILALFLQYGRAKEEQPEETVRKIVEGARAEGTRVRVASSPDSDREQGEGLSVEEVESERIEDAR